MVKAKIDELGHQASQDWMEATIESLQLKSSSRPVALRDLKFPIFTTNYDSMIEAASGIGSAAWTAPDDLHNVALGDSASVDHLHDICRERAAQCASSFAVLLEKL
ncbi:hypothetical protein [Arthrobacter zhaoguopingii]|uniref:hypothetical protein n=1 Tax=Arthrobacter zhaoguopingii TaxID=2681491 RepID=UPI00135804E6|nr:hypothetical protein [Arthrobacter zhaoguopingii]